MADGRPQLANLYHTGVVVEDIHAAIAAYSAIGMTFSEVRDISFEVLVDGKPRTAHIRAAYSQQGPPHVEFIQDLAGDIWAPDALDLNHLGFWVEDVEVAVAELERSGFALRVRPAATPPRLAYLSGPGSVWVELVAPAVRSSLEQWLATSYIAPAAPSVQS